MKVIIFKIHMIDIHMHSEMITTVKLFNISLYIVIYL